MTTKQTISEALWTHQITGLYASGMYFLTLDRINSALNELESKPENERGSEQFYDFLASMQRNVNPAIRERERAREEAIRG